jgi:hypothetical protein
VIGVTRTTVVPEAPDAALTGATILPGVPLPTWGRPAEPVLPDPPPAPPVPLAPPFEAAAPPPAPVPAPPPVVEFAAPAPALLDVAPTTPLEMPAPVETPAPVEPEVRQPRSHRRDAAGPVATAAVVTVGAQAGTDLLDVPVPQLAPPTPVPPRSEVYAAAGAAPPTAPWGAPPADPVDADPVDAVEMKPVDPVDAAEAAPVDLEDDDDHGADRPERPRRALLALGAFGGILVLGAVAAFVWPGFLVAEDQPAAAPRPAVSVATKVTLGAPDSAAGLSKISGAPAAALAKSAAGTDLTGYTSPVTAVYGTGTTPSATVIAWNATGHGAGADVSTAFAGYQQATGQPVTGIASAATGKLGGRMSCGSTVVGTTPASVCFWADDATFGAVTVLRPTDAKAGAATAVAIRTAMETRS